MHELIVPVVDVSLKEQIYQKYINIILKILKIYNYY